MKILLAVDGSHCTKRMLSYLATHEQLLGPGHEYTALTVVAPVPPHAARFLDRATLDGHYDHEAEQVLLPVRGFADQQGWRLATLHVVGHAAEEIAAVAERDHHDVIVMGTHGHSSLMGVALGSVATAVIARTRVPVLLVR